MNDFIKRLTEQIKTLWGKWSLVQKLTLIGIVVAALAGLVLVTTMSAQPSRVALIGQVIKDTNAVAAITARLDQEGIAYTLPDDGRIYVNDAKTKTRANAILFREGLIPTSVDPFAIFDVERWTITDFERDINKQRAMTQALEQHIGSLDDVDAVNVMLVMPTDSLFKEDQKATTASVRITPRPGSDIATNRKKIEGIVKLITFAIPGLKAENVTVTDQSGIVLNDFAGMAGMDRLELGKREMDFKRKMEAQYSDTILSALQTIYKSDRVRIVKLDLKLNTDVQSMAKEEHTPITMTAANPATNEPAVVVPSIVLSQSSNKENFSGTGFNPEGPAGQEGQTPPAYKDLANLVGNYSKDANIVNNAINTEKSTIEKSPIRIDGVSLAVALDGTWKKVYKADGTVDVEANGNIKRTYEALTQQAIQQAKSILQASIGYNSARGDQVAVENIAFDRTDQFEKENAEYRSQQQLQNTMLVVIVGLVVLLVAFAVFRIVSREMERRRRLREEELSRQHQAMREAALRSAEEEGVQVEMSVAERARLELQETAINMAREHPADVAQLIRTWMAEE
ncbi:MAG: flagellar basal-body MS-ring/collar protein FliF [Spirochaetales bacterium]